MRDIPVGNGSLLINFDEKYQMRDIYFPHVGQENHTEGYPCRFGIWAGGDFSWVGDDGWQRQLRYLPDTLVTDVYLANASLGVEVICNDTVASHENIFLRRVRITNRRSHQTEFRVFLHHDFRIYENKFGDTAFFDPQTGGLIHYKKHRYFLINSEPHFASFATGRKAFQGKEGTWRDAEDGNLQGSVITEGSVDSTVGVHFELEPDGEFEFFYWIAAGISYEGVSELNRLVFDRGPAGSSAAIAFTPTPSKFIPTPKFSHPISRIASPASSTCRRSTSDCFFVETTIWRNAASNVSTLASRRGRAVLSTLRPHVR
jgi:GH15 family glucan-1,4-alpha-glucosidase